jgi:DNA repair exonuclease SbcCD ATPase subunit
LNLERALTKSELEVSKIETKISEKKAQQKELKDLSDYYYGNVDTIKNKKEYESKLKEIKSKISKLESSLSNCESDTEELIRKIGYLEQKIENIDSNILRLQNLRKEYQAYDFYKSCVHNSGIPFEIIKMRLPVLNEEMSKILTNIVKFDVMFENNDDKLDINIKYPKYEPREIEMGSGAEKMISAMAIRLALLSISSLPKGDIFVLDEPATELDEDSMEGFTRILDSVKDYFKNVILISHIDALKDVVDQQVIIEHRHGYAHVEV